MRRTRAAPRGGEMQQMEGSYGIPYGILRVFSAPRGGEMQQMEGSYGTLRVFSPHLERAVLAHRRSPLEPSRRRDCHSAAPPLPLVGVPIAMEMGCQSNDSLADGYSSQVLDGAVDSSSRSVCEAPSCTFCS